MATRVVRTISMEIPLDSHTRIRATTGYIYTAGRRVRRVCARPRARARKHNSFEKKKKYIYMRKKLDYDPKKHKIDVRFWRYRFERAWRSETRLTSRLICKYNYLH